MSLGNGDSRAPRTFGSQGLTCDRCLDGRHVRCRRNGCGCPVCSRPPAPTPKKPAKPSKPKDPPKGRGQDDGPRKARQSRYEGVLCKTEDCEAKAMSNWMCTRHDNAARERARWRANGGGTQVERNLSEDQKRLILGLRRLGMTRAKIAVEAGCSLSSVGNVLRASR